MQTVIVTDDPSGWSFLDRLSTIISSQEYLSDEIFQQAKDLRIINLCSSYEHQTIGYYVSLLAQARDHKAIPSVHSIQDVINGYLSKVISQDLDDEMQHSLRDIKGDDFILSLYFGQNVAKRYTNLAKKLYGLFPLPMLRFILVRKRQKWQIKATYPLALKDVAPSHLEFMQDAAKSYLSKKRVYQWRKKQRFHSLAILVDPHEKNPPSNSKALQNFINAGEAKGINVDLIEKNISKGIAEYDALFIRTTTAINHYTYRIARRATQENLVVIDDPQSIIKCCNKIYLAELMKNHHILTPLTTFISKYDTVMPKLSYPCVLKRPDGAFSHGVVKIEDEKMLRKHLKQFFKSSDLVLAQTFIPTKFDWRIGIINNKPLFACRYFMVEGHWQIYNWDTEDGKLGGSCETVPLDKVPKSVIKIALKATRLIGDGLYGVDIKSVKNKDYVIEVNDNPSIDFGVEDLVLGDGVYAEIMQVFLERIRRKHGYA
ncbi:MAG: ribosomal protein S6 modification protein [Legionellales bacterium RIFCSPHIGHO2_12_FULL_37_14]|nr:MAG: ribosomal protein S6 modification protein [Legionellales bacterium RIFCSPHIGHO2_12_FULL_37_14]